MNLPETWRKAKEVAKVSETHLPGSTDVGEYDGEILI